MKDAKGHGSDAHSQGFTAGSGDGTVRNPYRSPADPNRLRWEEGWQAGVTHLNNTLAANALAGGGAKSAPAPTHDSMGYSPDAVNKAIASSNRAGRRIGGKEARAIHALLRGRH